MVKGTFRVVSKTEYANNRYVDVALKLERRVNDGATVMPHADDNVLRLQVDQSVAQDLVLGDQYVLELRPMRPTLEDAIKSNPDIYQLFRGS